METNFSVMALFLPKRKEGEYFLLNVDSLEF